MAARLVAVALAPQEADERLRIALRGAAHDAAAADPRCRIACITVVPPAAALSGVGRRGSPPPAATFRRLVELRNWAKPLGLPEERVTFHVLESDKPGAALVDYATMNDVSHLLLGASGGGTFPRRFTAVGAHVVAAAPCTVTVVRPRTED
jgi:nucleotide-binding universal stress UspA family protein